LTLCKIVQFKHYPMPDLCHSWISLPMLVKVFNPKSITILTNLIAFYNLWFIIRSNSFLLNLFTPFGTHRAAYAPNQQS